MIQAVAAGCAATTSDVDTVQVPGRIQQMGSSFDRQVEERLVRYVQIDTTSDEASPSSPSTDKQLDLLRLLVEELREIGARDVTLTAYGAVIGTIPATTDATVPAIAFLGHVDTSSGFSGTGVKPRVHRAYDGGDITFPDDPDLVLSPATSTYLASKQGDDIIAASGATLLGADDKAGVAIVMTLAQHLLAHPEIPHGEIRVCFTPDEEIGRGVHPDLPRDLNVAFAYTLDGGEVGEIVYETFSADKATVRIQGVSTHPGHAKDTMVNALHLAAKVIATLPQVTRTPETTADREGFLHVYTMTGTAAEATLEFILRDFEEEGLRSHGELLRQVCATVQATEPRARIACEITPQYRNMRYWLEKDMRPVELALQACRTLGIEPSSTPTRGGTDGSRLTEMGIPTPNLFTGMQDIHGPLEWISVQDMSRATELCVELVQQWTKDGNA
jgi:tripeptide aminopeptidase